MVSAFIKKALKGGSDTLRHFADDAEYEYYGKDLKNEPTNVGGKVVLPERKGEDIKTLTEVFEGIGYNGGINLDRVGELFDKKLSEFDSIAVEAKNLLQNAKQNNKDLFNHARRNEISVEQAIIMATEKGFDEIAHRFLKRQPGELLKPEDVAGGFLVLQRLVQDMQYGADNLLKLDESDLAGHIEAHDKLEALSQLYTYIASSVGGTVSEYGRGLSYASHLEKILGVSSSLIDQKLDNLVNAISPVRGINNPQTKIKEIRYNAKAFTVLDFASKNAYVGITSKIANKTRRIFMESYINALLSNPVTHTINLSANGAFQGVRLLETGMAVPIGVVRQKAMKMLGKEVDPMDRFYLGEVNEFVHGSAMSFMDAVRLSGKAFITGRSGDLKSKIDLDEDRIGVGNTNNIADILEDLSTGKPSGMARAFINSLGVLNRSSFRFLATEDEFFKVMIKGRVKYQEAFRASMREIQARVESGYPLKRTDDMPEEELSAEEYGAQAYERVLENPSKEVLKKMEQTALEETFQADVSLGGKYSSAINTALNNDVMKVLGVPFYRTPTALFKNSFDRSLNVFTAPKKLAEGKGREFDEAVAKLVVGWGLATTLFFMTRNYYGDDTIIIGNGPVANYQFKDIVNKGANVPSCSVGFKQENGSYKFATFSRFDPLSMLACASADVSNFMTYSDDPEVSEALFNSFVLAVTEYSSSLPMLQGISDLGTLFTDRNQTGEKKFERFQRFLAQRATDATLSAGGNLLGIGYYFSKEGGQYPFVGSTSFQAGIERIYNPYGSITMIREDQLARMGTDRLEEVPVAIRAIYETINRHKSRNALYSNETYQSVNFWNEPVRQISPENLADLDVDFSGFELSVPGGLISMFNPIRIQSGDFSPLDQELTRLALGGYGKFANHSKKMRGYYLTAEDYINFVGYVNDVDKEGRIPGDDNYQVSERLLPSLDNAIKSTEYLKLDDENKFLYLNDILNNRKAGAREKLFSSGRLGNLFNRDNSTIQ